MSHDSIPQNDASFSESFASLFEENVNESPNLEKTVVKGTVVALSKDMVIIDVGLKSEGRVPLREFSQFGQDPEVKVGDEISVFIDRYENRNGEISLSVEKARREAAWMELDKACNEERFVNGTIFGKVKGGFAVDLNGAVAFLPGSQVDIRPIRDLSPLMNIVQPFKILKMDKVRSNIVVSRRSVIEESRLEQRSEIISNLGEGQVVEGIVKNVTDYGAFIDLGGVDGLLHITDISWRRVNHPSDVLTLGETIKVQVIRFNRETQRISLGLKQLESDPWKTVEEKYQAGSRHTGKITNITDYGAFVELEPGVEGLIYVTEMSWVKKNVHPSKILTVAQEVDVMVLELDMSKRRISLGMKQCMENPWETFKAQHPIGSTLEGPVKNITEFGLFIGVSDDLDGMIHLSDLSWNENEDEAVQKYSVGQHTTVKVLDVDPSKERIALGVKQLSEDPFANATSSLKKGDVVKGKVTTTNKDGVEIAIHDGITGFIKKNDLSRDRSLQQPERFSEGEEIEAHILQVDPIKRRVSLSIRSLELAEEKAVLSEIGSKDGGTSIGDLIKEKLQESK
jgi:small subunit ribosomal protein S1